MKLDEVLRSIIYPTYRLLLPGLFNTREATVMLLAIGQQESRFEHRRQVGGPARGFWQFEEGGGVAGVLRHGSSHLYARAVCQLRCLLVPPTPHDVYLQLEHDDLLACAFARLLLLTDPRPLPMVGDVKEAWAYYERNWRPGKPHPEMWAARYKRAVEATA